MAIRRNLGDQYTKEVLQPLVVLHFDNHPLAAIPVIMNDKFTCRPHLSKVVTTFFLGKAVMAIPLTAMSSNLNPIEHI